jgi:hypothetical protein
VDALPSVLLDLWENDNPPVFQGVSSFASYRKIFDCHYGENGLSYFAIVAIFSMNGYGENGVKIPP